ncbi:meiosis-specific nuclear structural protein 1-like [Homarus americanus]|uniref:meiosis-specific nuclear structural protein 1-like n=1 Tax=Homarus americanus TaxID=6706 RepID=UPI001C439E25|nr:meiosis-specific nuclear structural protein 1-like [Homarus americanus]
MEKNMWNAAVLRRQIMSSSPELRALEAKIHACALTRDNSAAIAEKDAQRKLSNAKDKQYAELLEKLDCEEVMSAAITDTEIRARRLETQRVLKEQIAEKAASKAKAEAEKTIAMMSEVDEVRVMNQEREEQLKKKHKSHTLSRQFLLTQSRLKQLQQEERDLDDRKLTRATEEYNLRAELKKELGRQEEEMVRLQQNQRELALVKQLEMEQQEKEVLRHTRLEVELLEKQVEERKLAEEKQRREEASRINLKNGWDSQLQYKQEQLAREQAKEEEYRKMLLEVLAEEARLDQLVSEARRRRQLDHRFLVDQLLEERRTMRATIMRQQQEEDLYEHQYQQLRKSILEEEEKQLLLRHAPQLMPHFTPQLLARLRQLL